MLQRSLYLLCVVVSLAEGDWQDEKPKEHHHEHYEHVKNIVVTKEVPKPVPVEVEKPVPYEVKVPVDKPYPVYVPQPYNVYVEKKVPYQVKVPVPSPYVVEKKVPYEVKVQVDRPYPVEVPKPYNVYVEKKVPYYVEKKVPYKVQVPVEKKYPVHYPVEKKVPFPVVKEVPYEVKVPVEKPVPYKVEKPVPYHVEKVVHYPVLKEVPYPVNVPYRVEVKVPVRVEAGNQGSVSSGSDGAGQQYHSGSGGFSSLGGYSSGLQHLHESPSSGGYATSYANQNSVSVNIVHPGSNFGHRQSVGSDDAWKQYPSHAGSIGSGGFSPSGNQHFFEGEAGKQIPGNYENFGFEDSSRKQIENNTGGSQSAVHDPRPLLNHESFGHTSVSSGFEGYLSSHLEAPINQEHPGPSYYQNQGWQSPSGSGSGNLELNSSSGGSLKQTEAIFGHSPHSS